MDVSFPGWTQSPFPLRYQITLPRKQASPLPKPAPRRGPSPPGLLEPDWAGERGSGPECEGCQEAPGEAPLRSGSPGPADEGQQGDSDLLIGLDPRGLGPTGSGEHTCECERLGTRDETLALGTGDRTPHRGSGEGTRSAGGASARLSDPPWVLRGDHSLQPPWGLPRPCPCHSLTARVLDLPPWP